MKYYPSRFIRLVFYFQINMEHILATVAAMKIERMKREIDAVYLVQTISNTIHMYPPAALFFLGRHFLTQCPNKWLQIQAAKFILTAATEGCKQAMEFVDSLSYRDMCSNKNLSNEEKQNVLVALWNYRQTQEIIKFY